MVLSQDVGEGVGVSMHDDQVQITVDQVRALVVEQFASLDGVEVVAAQGSGTVNSVFRVGDRATVRFPFRAADPERLRAGLVLWQRRSFRGHPQRRAVVAAPRERPGSGPCTDGAFNASSPRGEDADPVTFTMPPPVS